MKKTECLNHIAIFDIDSIKDCLEYSTGWDLHQQKRNFKSNHIHTESIFITELDLTWDGTEYNLVHHNENPELHQHTLKIISELERIYDGIVGRSMYARLKAGKEIPPHIDRHYYLTCVHRNHIPIITNDKVMFTVDNESINMKEGHCYEINNSKTHSVINGGDQDRTHLIVDIIPKWAFKNVDCIPNK